MRIQGGRSFVDESGRLWTKCSELLQDRVPESTWRTWFQSARPLPTEDESLTLAVPSTVVKERIEAKFLPILQEAVAGVTGRATPVHLLVDKTLSGLDEAFTDESDDSLRSLQALDWHELGDSDAQRIGISDPANSGKYQAGGLFDAAPGLDSPKPPQTAHGHKDRWSSTDDEPGETDRDGSRVSDRFTFEAFVIGSSNRFAHAAALSVAETPAKSYNPLFIHGEAGLGKTHLLHAIGNYVRAHYPSYKVRYVSTETFTNDFIESVRRGTMSEFKRRYRECDVLLVDDIQFIEGKESTQEEFFHTFNSLHGASKQIVITSDRPPKAIATLENRLRSRFLSGLITDVQPPDLETRLAILRKKALSEGVSLSDEVMEFIATHVTDNIRELEGAFIRASAFASLSGTPLDRHLAEQVLSDLVTEKVAHVVTPATIIELTAKSFGFSAQELCSSSRRRPLTTARQVAMYLCRELTDYSYPAIGAEFGGRDHTTVIHAVSKVSALMMQSKQIYEQVSGLIHQLKESG
jgi:chromosomal replication initiator protein